MSRFDSLQEVLKLVTETGDRVVVMPENADPFVVMNIKQYRELIMQAAQKENFSKMTEDELLDKINRDIAEWRSAQGAAYQDYDLSQFRIDASKTALKQEKPVSKPRQPFGPATPPASSQETRQPQYPNEGPALPVVSDTVANEYKLEPLS